MKVRCKPGDLALVLFGLPGCHENIGKLVRVLPGLHWHSQVDLHCWPIQPVQNHRWLVVEDDWSITLDDLDPDNRFVHPDCWLLPIRDVGVLVQLSQDVKNESTKEFSIVE